MKISQKEFELKIQMLINGEITKVKLAKELRTDVRTLDNRIQEMSLYNTELYLEYLKALPYKQKEYNHIDFEALLIYMLKQGKTVDQVSDEFEISPRTVRRRINNIENKELVELYRNVANNRKRRKKDDEYIQQRIEELTQRDIVLGNINDKREKELLEIEERFNKLCEKMSKTEAARLMGYKDRDRIYKLLNELYKIKIEKNTKNSIEGDFKKRIVVKKEQMCSEKNEDINIKEKEIFESREEGR